MKYVLLFVGIVLFLASIVPLFQLIKSRCNGKTLCRYYFSQVLLDYDMDNIKFENTFDLKENINRMQLANRGWIRCPNGAIMNNEMFEQKKRVEYEIELP